MTNRARVGGGCWWLLVGGVGVGWSGLLRGESVREGSASVVCTRLVRRGETRMGEHSRGRVAPGSGWRCGVPVVWRWARERESERDERDEREKRENKQESRSRSEREEGVLYQTTRRNTRSPNPQPAPQTRRCLKKETGKKLQQHHLFSLSLCYHTLTHSCTLHDQHLAHHYHSPRTSHLSPFSHQVSQLCSVPVHSLST